MVHRKTTYRNYQHDIDTTYRNCRYDIQQDYSRGGTERETRRVDNLNINSGHREKSKKLQYVVTPRQPHPRSELKLLEDSVGYVLQR